jgi:hypothetical protein
LKTLWDYSESIQIRLGWVSSTCDTSTKAPVAPPVAETLARRLAFSSNRRDSGVAVSMQSIKRRKNHCDYRFFDLQKVET